MPCAARVLPRLHGTRACPPNMRMLAANRRGCDVRAGLSMLPAMGRCCSGTRTGRHRASVLRSCVAAPAASVGPWMGLTSSMPWRCALSPGYLPPLAGRHVHVLSRMWVSQPHSGTGRLALGQPPKPPESRAPGASSLTFLYIQQQQQQRWHADRATSCRRTRSWRPCCGWSTWQRSAVACTWWATSCNGWPPSPLTGGMPPPRSFSARCSGAPRKAESYPAPWAHLEQPLMADTNVQKDLWIS